MFVIAVVWLPVVVSLCVWHGMTRENGEEICLPRWAQPASISTLSNVISDLHQPTPWAFRARPSEWMSD